MSIKARVIKETTNTQRRKAIYQLGKKHTFKEPVIIVLESQNRTLSIHGNIPIESYINLDKVGDNIEIVKIESNVNTGVIYIDPSTIIFRIYSAKVPIHLVKKAIDESVIELLQTKGIEAKLSTHRLYPNDLVFMKDGREKKFLGSIMDTKENYFGFMITLHFDNELIQNIFKLDSPKIKLRGDITNLSEIVGGLDEVCPSIDKGIVDELIDLFSKKLDWKVEASSFTKTEEALLK
jgi:lipoate-protein ligase A